MNDTWRPFLEVKYYDKKWVATWGMGFMIYGNAVSKNKDKAIRNARKQLQKYYDKWIDNKNGEAAMIRYEGMQALLGEE